MYQTQYGSTEDPYAMSEERISGLKQWLLDRIAVQINDKLRPTTEEE